MWFCTEPDGVGRSRESVLIPTIRSQPLFGLFQIEAFALCVAFELVFGHGADVEIFSFGVGEIELGAVCLQKQLIIIAEVIDAVTLLASDLV